MPSKQKIGKQRKKEKKKQQKANDRRNGIRNNTSNNNRRRPSLSPHVKSFLEWRRQGLWSSTDIQKGLAECLEEPRFGLEPYATFVAMGNKFISTEMRIHLTSSLLSFLKRCENETFDQVTLYVGSEIISPSIWITILSGVVYHDEASSCTLQIVENIGPLVKCMCDDTKCLFFKSNGDWADAVIEFVDLIRLIVNDVVKSEQRDTPEMHKTIDILLQYDGLLSSIVQWCFWDNARPDLVLKLGDKTCTTIADWSRRSLEQLVIGKGFQEHNNTRCITEFGKRWLNQLGSTPIVSKDSAPSCRVSSVAGLIRLLESSLDDGGADDISTLHPRLLCLAYLMEGADCVDKGVITEIIKVGNKLTQDSELRLVHAVASLAFVMLLRDTDIRKTTPYTDIKGHPSDTRVAFAIRNGLIEMCFNFITCFGCRESFCRSDTNVYTFLPPSLSLFKYIESIFKAVHLSSFDNKTWKAIRRKKIEIELELVRLEQNTDISSNANCQSLLDMIRSIINLNGTYCCRCNKPLERKAVKQCEGCNCMTYCSESCQRDDWLNGHKLTCSKPYAEENGGRFQGRIYPQTVPQNERDAAKLKDLDINMTSIQLKLFLDHSETILDQARSLDISLCDCVVFFDFEYCPPTIYVKSIHDDYYLSSEKEKEGFESTRSTDKITCVYESYIYHGWAEENGQVVPDYQMQRLFPIEWLSKQTIVTPRVKVNSSD